MDSGQFRRWIAFNMLSNEDIRAELLQLIEGNMNFSETTYLGTDNKPNDAQPINVEKLFKCFKREWPKPSVDYEKLEREFFTNFFGFYLEN